MDYSNEIPKNCSLIRENRVTLLIRDDFKENLLKHGILDPRRLISSAPKEGPAYRGRGPLPTFPLIDGGRERVVAKQALRGGLLRFLNRDLFWRGNRPFEEMIANTQILSKGIRTTEILAAAKQKVLGPLYRNFLFSKEVSDSTDLSGLFNGLKQQAPRERLTKKKQVIKAIAHAIFMMHNKGIYHPDLHLKNILIRQGSGSAEPEVYIIDFDKALIKERLSIEEKVDNLFRFNRSLEKYKVQGGAVTRGDQARVLKEYIKYDSQLSDIFIVNYRKYLRSLKLRRLKWALFGTGSPTSRAA